MLSIEDEKIIDKMVDEMLNDEFKDCKFKVKYINLYGGISCWFCKTLAECMEHFKYASNGRIIITTVAD